MYDALQLQRKTELLGKCHKCWKIREGHEHELPRNGICAQCPGEKKKEEQIQLPGMPNKTRQEW